MYFVVFFFFSSRRRHTRWPRDWSSDVCSSDLVDNPRRMRKGGIPAPGPGERDTVVDGVRWRSRETPGRGNPVVFVHGHLASSASWKEILVSASAGRPAIAVDLPGFGFSDRPWPY